MEFVKNRIVLAKDRTCYHKVMTIANKLILEETFWRCRLNFTELQDDNKIWMPNFCVSFPYYQRGNNLLNHVSYLMMNDLQSQTRLCNIAQVLRFTQFWHCTMQSLIHLPVEKEQGFVSFVVWNGHASVYWVHPQLSWWVTRNFKAATTFSCCYLSLHHQFW